MRKFTVFFYFLLSMILPLIFIIIWFMKNNVLPTGDAANYLSTAYDIEKIFHQQGYLSGLMGLFLLRGWRPIIFPVFIVPYLIFFHGNLMYAYIAFEITVFIISAVYTYKYFRLWLSYFPSIIATNIILLLPHVQTMMINLYSESLLYPFMIASIYYMVKSEYFSRKYYSVMSACFLSLSILTRPVEVIFHLFPIFSYYSVSFYRESRDNLEKFLSILIYLAFSVFLFLYKAKLFNEFSFVSSRASILILEVFFFTALLFYLKLKNNNIKFKYFTRVVYFLIFIGMIWYLPFAKQTYSWIYETSFGSVAQGTKALIYDPEYLLNKVLMHVSVDGRLIVGSIGMLALISYILNFRKSRLPSRHYLPVLFLFSTAIIPFLEILFTVQDSVKKSAEFIPCLIIGLLMISLVKGPFYRTKIITAVLILLMEFSLLIVTVFQIYPFSHQLNIMIGYSIPSPKINFSYDQVYKFLEEKQKKYHFHNVSLVINADTMEPVDPFLFDVLTAVKTNEFTAGYTYIPFYSDSTEMELGNKVDAIYLADRIDRMKIDAYAKKYYQEKFEKESNANLKLRYKLLYYYSSNFLAKKGWKLIGCQELYQSFLSDPVISASYDSDGSGCLYIKNTVI